MQTRRAVNNQSHWGLRLVLLIEDMNATKREALTPWSFGHCGFVANLAPISWEYFEKEKPFQQVGLVSCHCSLVLIINSSWRMHYIRTHV